ncbi:1,3-beta-glucan synthase regulator [Bacillus cereus]|uniref:SMI1/KNR4 family protein n=1 Tax=Bacillus nitratireducens TaxID=2026193 RepID=UPI000BF4ABA5|nr:SMI1/KNR4 family protein [Bacillus nitratireducens]MED0903247.1 SMI1/KNR4 family protein [Bacillus nitratireducens]PFI44904.1 1,3-beta-glucan synthase regulator [Bacillus cereus]PFS09604.1 1,3-beta-glucan synthase regulator [Bacillus cereus]
MKIELLNAIDEELEMCPEAFGGTVNIEEVTQAEVELKVKLPEDFKMFLLKYGSGAVGEAIVLGLREAEFVATPSFVEKSLQFRNILPEGYENFIVIGIDSAGNPVGFNSPNTEIITFDFDFGGKEIIASGFEEYLEKALKEEINIHF